MKLLLKLSVARASLLRLDLLSVRVRQVISYQACTSHRGISADDRSLLNKVNTVFTVSLS